MRLTTFSTCLAATVLALAACGGSDGGAASGDQGRVADLVIGLAEDEGFDLDEKCVNDTVSDLSDTDAKALADAGLDGDAELSDEAEAIGEKVFTECVDAATYIESFVDSFAESDPSIDADCIKQQLEGLTVDAANDKIFEAATACTDG